VGGYRDLLTFKQCEEIFDLTNSFCEKFLPGRENLRQREQMIQAARSAKQCIAEGASQGTSLKGYIKMLGVSRGSLEELLLDYGDFARLRKIPVWSRNDPRLYNPNFSSPSDPSYPLNYLIDLITRTNYLLDKQRRSLEEKFIKEGGYSEKLLQRRLNYRREAPSD